MAWAHLNSLDCFAGAFNLFCEAGLQDIVALKCDYNEEIVRQFYFTVYVSPSFDQMIWMTGTQKVEVSKADFEQALRTYLSSHGKVYNCAALQTPAWCDFYDRDKRYTLEKIVGLLPLPSLINRIINHTFFSKSENFDVIRGHALNLIDPYNQRDSLFRE